MPMASLTSISREVKARIIDYCNNNELKTLRLASAHWQDLAVSKLFSVLTVYPCTRSLDRLVHIARSNRLRHLVQTLVYDGTVLGSAGKPKANVDNVELLRYLRNTFSYLSGLKAISIIDTSTNRDLDLEIFPSSASAQIEESAPNGSIVLSLTPCSTSCSSGCLTSHVCSIWESLHYLPNPIEILDIQGFFWSRLFCSRLSVQHDSVSERSFSALKGLHLEPMSQSIFFSSINMPDLQDVLRQAVSLETLHINFGMTQCGSGGQAQSVFDVSPQSEGALCPTLDLVPQLCWSTFITELHLTGLVCTLTELRSILTHCANTLRLLSLGNMTLVPDAPDARPSCLVAMLNWIRTSMNLQEVRFHGYLSNEDSQRWEISDLNHGDNSLLARVEDFIINGGICPLNHVSLDTDYMDFVWGVSCSIGSDHAMDALVQGDDSWRMVYETDESGDWSSDEDYPMDEYESGIWNRIQLQAA